MSVDVICAGFGRTGTLSLKAALEELGFTRCWHIEDMTRGARNPDPPLLTWQRLAQGQTIDWAQLLDGYRAVTDFPICLYYRELMGTFPAARVLLTVRDPAAWAQSMQALRRHFLTITSTPQMQSGPGKIWHDTMEALVWSKLGDIDDTASLVSIFDRHVAAVRDTVPAEKLLSFEVRQGWAPLCRFLNVPQPEKPFPHLNERSGLAGGSS